MKYLVIVEAISRIIQSLGIGVGAFFGALGGYQTFSDWREGNREKEKRAWMFRRNFPRRNLNETFRLIRSKTDQDRVYLVDLRKNQKHWIKNMNTMKKLGFGSSDVFEVSEGEFKSYKEEDEIG
ncbi:MAG TPA: hypothetical protein VJZ52_00810 [Candidatus Paceibacterota bacterium]|nr:hypothetical protein [Candidatus Paceibacterota bacterium]